MASPYFFIKDLRQFCEASFRVLHFYASWKSVEKYKGEHIIVEGKKSPPEKDFAHVAKKPRGKK